MWISGVHFWIVCACGALTCICGLCAQVDLSRAFVDHPVCGSLACISGLCVCMWSSHMHLWIVYASVDLSRAFVYRPVDPCVHLWIVCVSVDLLRAFVDCVRKCGSLVCICGRI